MTPPNPQSIGVGDLGADGRLRTPSGTLGEYPDVTPPEFFQIAAPNEFAAVERRRELQETGTNTLRVKVLLTQKQLEALQWNAKGLSDVDAARKMQIERPAFNRLKNRAERRVRWLENFIRRNGARPTEVRRLLGIT